ncbi:MAG: cytochrome c3 family protein [Gemmatimonadota bacterium]
MSGGGASNALRPFPQTHREHALMTKPSATGFAVALAAAGLLLVAAPATPQTAGPPACLDCHGPAAAGADGAPAVDAAALGRSTHADLACRDCHADAGGEPHQPGLAAVDCAACHPDEGAQYRESVHGRAVAAGNQAAPRCTSCHGAHDVVAPADAASPVAAANLPGTCASCHDEERIAAAYGLPPRRLATYLDSFHGVASRFGETRAANCASCHGVHHILPSADPRSSIHPDNLPATCGACHPGARAGLEGVKIHVEATPEGSRGMYYVRQFYTYFTGGLMLCFVAYVSIELYGSIRRRRHP